MTVTHRTTSPGSIKPRDRYAVVGNLIVLVPGWSRDGGTPKPPAAPRGGKAA